MSKHTNVIRSGTSMPIWAFAALIAPFSPAFAAKPVHESRAADSQGSVEINNVAGSIEVMGWDRSEVDVTGSAGNDVERVDVTGDGSRTSIQVVLRSSHNWSRNGEAHLVIHVPAKSSVSSALVSADFTVSNVLGDLKVQSVSGEVRGEVGGDVHANTVSGDVHLAAKSAKALEIKTVSGDIVATGGDGQSEITTVSGDAKIALGTQSRAHFKTVSGTVLASLGLGPDAQVDGESVSGDISLDFASLPSGDFDVQSFSGDIENCFGPKPTESRHGSGSRLMFKSGEGRAHVHVNTQSGDVRICAKGEHR